MSSSSPESPVMTHDVVNAGLWFWQCAIVFAALSLARCLEYFVQVIINLGALKTFYLRYRICLEQRLLKRLVLNLRCEFVMQISLHITRQFNFTLYILARVSRIIVSPVVWFRPARGTAWMTRILTGFIIAIPLFTRTWTRRNRGQTPPFVRRFGRAWRLTPFRLLFFNMLLRGVVMNWFGCESQENTLLYLIEVCEVKSMLKIFRIERRNKFFEPKCTFLSKNNIFSVGSRDVTSISSRSLRK